ncbi:MAG: hypothetical protein V4616_14580, partial [Bacteroidota bacterium]
RRTCGGIYNDLRKFLPHNLLLRLMTIARLRTDDYDIYDWVIGLHQSNRTALRFFILNAKRTKHDPGLPRNSAGIRALTSKFSKNQVPFGIHPSYY